MWCCMERKVLDKHFLVERTPVECERHNSGGMKRLVGELCVQPEIRLCGWLETVGV